LRANDMSDAPEVILLVNGPGELYTWARPLVTALREAAFGTARNPRVVLGLLPCPFASGYERGIAETMPVDDVVSVAENLEFIAGGRKPRAYRNSASGLVIGLGGDVSFPGRIGSRLGYPAWRYSFEPYWNKGLEKLLVHDARTLEKALKAGANVTNIGNLTADALQLEQPVDKPEGLDVLIIPGSRSFQVKHLLPFFAGVAQDIAVQVSNVRFHVPRSRLVTDEDWATGLSGRLVMDMGGVPLAVGAQGAAPLRLGSQILETPTGVQIHVHDEDHRYQLMKLADVALTIPGTNTLELGIAGVPSVVCLPLQKMELIPIENPLRYLEVIPVIGKPLKRRLVEVFLNRFEHVSLPNIIAGEAIQIELRGDLSTTRIASEAVRLLEQPMERARITSRLEATMPKPGTARRLAAMMLERVAG
jgi:Lipid-A-disaccharide synthetase